MHRSSHVIYTIITIGTACILIYLFQCPLPLAVRTGACIPAEPIRTWHTGTIIRTREWPNNKCFWCFHCWIIKSIMYWVWITSALRMPPCQHPAIWDSRGGSHRFKRWPPPCMWCGTLFRVAPSFVWHLVSHTLCRIPHDCAYNMYIK